MLTAVSIVTVLLAQAPGPSGVLTLERALALARERSPAVLLARARVDEARAALEGASLLLQENPELRAAAGRRETPEEEFHDLELGLAQRFPLGGARRARIDAAGAGVSREEARSEELTRLALRDVAATFHRALHAGERLGLRRAAVDLAQATLRAARMRHEAGDVAVLDVNVARTALARARSELSGAEADRADLLGRLRLLLAMEAGAPLEPAGDLALGPVPALEELLARAEGRPDLRALEEEIAQAEAEVRLGETARWPGLDLGVQYEREEEATALMGTVGLTLPLFQREQGARAGARARAGRLRLEREILGRAVAEEVRTSFEIHARRAEAVRHLEEEALPVLGENETLSARSYELGQMSLAELLVIRGEVVETRLEHLDRLLEAALARVDLEHVAGVSR